MMTKDGEFKIVNSRFQEALGIPIEEIEGKKYFEVFSEDINKLAQPLIQQCLNGHITDIDYPINFPTGERIHAFGKYIPLLDNDKEVIGVLSYVADISKLKKTESALMESNFTKGKILSILSHDLKTPINSLSGLLSVANEIAQEDFTGLTVRLSDQVNSLSFTMDNLLNWVKTQLDGFKVNKQQTDVSSIINQCICLYNNQLVNKKIRIENLVMDESYAYVDTDNLSLVIRNILSNAIKFTPESGTIIFDVLYDKNTMLLSIKDCGTGIEKSKIEVIRKGFDKTVPYTSVGTSGEKGTGLGIAFCVDLLEMNNAEMDIESEVDKGTKITLRLPVKK